MSTSHSPRPPDMPHLTPTQAGRLGGQATPNQQTLALLRAARTHIEAGWCQGALGRTPEGTALEGHMLSQACQVSAVGALRKAALSLPEADRTRVVEQAYRALVAFVPPGVCVGDFNDDEGTTQADVLRLYDRATVRLETPHEPPRLRRRDHHALCRPPALDACGDSVGRPGREALMFDLARRIGVLALPVLLIGAVLFSVLFALFYDRRGG